MRMLKRGELPDAGGLSGVKRMQMQQRSSDPSSTKNNTGVVPPKVPRKTMPAGYENATRLSAMSNPKFPRRRGQG